MLSDAKVSCPRCGYDQRGVMAQWTESCALEGRCAECGLDYRWAELLVPEKFEPLWCVEFARGWWKVLCSCFGTLMRALWPWGFWKRLTMAHAVRWRRIVLFWAFLLLMLSVCFVIEQAAVAVRVRTLIEAETANHGIILRSQLAQTTQYIADLEAMTFENGEPAETDSYIANFITTEQQRDDELANVRLRLPALQAAQGQIPTMQQPVWRAIAEAVFTPWRSRSFGSIRWPMFGVRQYPAPADLHSVLLMDAMMLTGSTVNPGPTMDVVRSGIVMGIILIVLIPIEFVLLPMSRRKAKVQWRHVWRVAAYSVIIPALVVVLGLLALLSIAIVPSVQDHVLRFGSIVALLTGVLVVLWWAVAIGRYMKIPRGWIIAPLFAVVAILIAWAALFWGMQAFFGPLATL